MGSRSGVHLPTENTRGNKKMKVDEVDRISELPDHILASILSRLTLAEACRTSVLSVRWRDVWIIRDTVLDFRHHPPVTEQHWISLTSQIQYIDWVDEVLEKHKEPTLDEFAVESDWLSNSTLSKRIFNWIYFAIRKRVRRLDLALSSFVYRKLSLKLVGYNGYDYSRPYNCGHHFPNLNFLISEVEGFSSFVTTLQVLRLQCFNVDAELLVYLLSNCPVLEHLSVSFSESLVNLQVQAPSVLNLKHFEIQNNPNIKTIHFDYAPNLERFLCFGFDVRVSIESAPNLKYMNCFGSNENIYIKSAPKLMDVSLGPRHIVHLSNHFSQLEVLTLEVNGDRSTWNCENIDGLDFKQFPTLIHLQQFILRLRYRFKHIDLNGLLIEMPSLYSLHLEVEHKMPPPPSYWLSTKRLSTKHRHRHECLKLIEWSGFTGDRNDYCVLKDLVANCKILEKVKITKGKTNIDDGVWSYNYDKKDLSKMKKLAMRALEKAGVELIIL